MTSTFVAAAVAKGEGLTVKQIAGRAGVSGTTVWRWLTCGAKAPGGGRVRLAGVRAGRSWRSCEEALSAFLAAGVR